MHIVEAARAGSRAFLVGALFMFTVGARRAPPAWVVAPLDGRVAVMFPQQPQHRPHGDELTLVVETPRLVLTALRRPLSARLSAVSTPAEVASLLRTVARGAVGASGGRVLSSREINITAADSTALPTWGQEIAYAPADPQAAVAVRRLWLLDRTLYWLDCAPHRTTKRALAEQAQFLAGVRISPAPPPVAADPAPRARRPATKRAARRP